MELDLAVKKNYGDFTLDLSFKSSADILGILGASGSGKSMTLKILAGILKADTGHLFLNDKVFYNSDKKICMPSRKRKVGYLFQDYALFPQMTVEENIAFGLFKDKPKVVEEKVYDIIKAMHLEGLEKRVPSQLSGGQKQRVALGRALVLKPDLLLLDEPFSALDSYLRFQLIEQLREILSTFKGKTIFVTHNMREAYRICDELLILNEGRLETQGDKKTIFKKPTSLRTLELTGCKNISVAKRFSDYEVLAEDWGVTFTTINKVPEKLSYLGFRDRHLKLADEEQTLNCFDLKVIDCIENPNDVSLYLAFNNSITKPNKYHIHWEVSEFQYNMLKGKENLWKLYFSPEHIVLV